MKTMFKNKTEILGVMLVIILAIGSLPNFFYGSNHWQAYADLQIEVITPTGGTLSSTSDCWATVSGNDVTWHLCNTTLYALNSTNQVFASFTVSTATQDDEMLASVSGNTVFIADSVTGLSKYTLSGSTISLTGNVDPSSCTIGADIQFDTLGYIWSPCNPEDSVIRINPNTMTINTQSQDLTDGVGIECDGPTTMAFAPADNIGVIRCATNGVQVTFSIASSTSITLLDSDAGTIGNIREMIHERYNRIINSDGSEVEVWDYTAGGITTLSKTFTIDNDECEIEPYLSADVFVLCQNDIGTDTNVFSFFSNSTNVFQISNNIVSGFDDGSRIGFDIQEQIWYIPSFLNDERFIKLSGLRSIIIEPDPPSNNGGSNIVGGVDCSLAENENKLICRVSDDGAIGNFIIGNGTSGLTGLVCNLGVVSCADDSNPQTNGAGLLVFIASLFVIVGMFYVAMGRNAFAMPVFIWIIIIIALSAFFTITGIIDPIFLILSIVAIVALAVPRLMGVIRGGNTMGGGSSE